MNVKKLKKTNKQQQLKKIYKKIHSKPQICTFRLKIIWNMLNLFFIVRKSSFCTHLLILHSTVLNQYLCLQCVLVCCQVFITVLRGLNDCMDKAVFSLLVSLVHHLPVLFWMLQVWTSCWSICRPFRYYSHHAMLKYYNEYQSKADKSSVWICSS